ncbi:hypothetical protein [Thermogemmatispora sp.]|uniref:hypothetical protein n=1 Tax=Thermogemmatispora sp. TaxID=1968838 RepID=UPI0035E45307
MAALVLDEVPDPLVVDLLRRVGLPPLPEWASASPAETRAFFGAEEPPDPGMSAP